MRALVTGVAGFIGSTLAEELLRRSHYVRGVDSFTSFYSAAAKRRNLQNLLIQSDFSFQETDLRYCELSPLLTGVDTVFHLAAQPVYDYPGRTDSHCTISTTFWLRSVCWRRLEMHR